MITKEQKAAIENKLSSIYGRVVLLCDGYEVSLVVEQSGRLKFAVMTYVNGLFKGVWIINKDGETHPEQKFLRKREKALYSPSQLARLTKALGKKYIKANPSYTKKLVSYHPAWPSGKAAINHLLKVCDSVELVDEN